MIGILFTNSNTLNGGTRVVPIETAAKSGNIYWSSCTLKEKVLH